MLGGEKRGLGVIHSKNQVLLDIHRLPPALPCNLHIWSVPITRSQAGIRLTSVARPDRLHEDLEVILTTKPLATWTVATGTVPRIGPGLSSGHGSSGACNRRGTRKFSTMKRTKKYLKPTKRNVRTRTRCADVSESWTSLSYLRTRAHCCTIIAPRPHERGMTRPRNQ
jgi:hypothetical protein